MRAATTILFASLIGCAGAGDGTPPTLEVTSPTRGTTNDSATVTVTGKALDDGAVSVTVNGTSVAPGADGTFTTDIAVGTGITFIETIAADGDGNQVRDVRAVLAGTLAATDGSVASAVGARAGANALRAMGDGMGTTAEGIDFTGLAKASNPVFYDGGCLGARVDVTSVDIPNIDVLLLPKDGALAADIELDNVVVRLHADYEVSCINGSSNITVRSTTAKISGDLGVGVANGKITTSLANVDVVLEGFTFDASGIPGVIEDMIKGKVRSGIESRLEGIIADKVPPIANRELAKLIAQPFAADVLGHPTTITVEPSQATISPDGVFVAIDTHLLVTGAEGGMFASNPMALTQDLMPASQGIGIAMEDDVANQLFASLWSTGAFDVALPIESAGPVAALLDERTATLEVKMSLPPTLSTDEGMAKLSIGDLIVTAKDGTGAELQKLALSIRTTIEAEPSQSNKILLTLGTPEVKANIISQVADVARPLTDESVEGIVVGVWGVVGGLAGDTLNKLPMPTIAGIELGAPAVMSVPGFIVGDMALR